MSPHVLLQRGPIGQGGCTRGVGAGATIEPVKPRDSKPTLFLKIFLNFLGRAFSLPTEGYP